MTSKQKTIIPINEEYRITADEYQWIIQKKRSRKGKEDWKSQHFFGTLEAAVKDLGGLMVRRSGAQTLVDALEAVEMITTTLSQALTPQIDGLLQPPDSGEER